MGPIGYPETMVQNCHSTLRNISNSADFIPEANLRLGQIPNGRQVETFEVV